MINDELREEDFRWLNYFELKEEVRIYGKEVKNFEKGLDEWLIRIKRVEKILKGFDGVENYGTRIMWFMYKF